MQLYRVDQTATPAETALYDQQEIRPEETLESWLHANPAIILDEPLLVVGRQVRLDTGVADLVACDQFGNMVVGEVKIGRSGSGSASEETILSQPQNYAQSLATHDYEELNRIYCEYREDLQEGRWDIEFEEHTPQTLGEAFEATFGRSLEPDQFNDRQRLVIIAETITARTERNARYLLEQGIDIQCQEVRLFQPPGDGSPVLATSVVVNYPLSNVRPAGKGHPAYPEINRTIVTRAFPEIADLVQIETPHELVQGFDERQPRILSQHPDHPASVTYRLYVNPEQDSVLIALDIQGADKRAVARVQEHYAKFTDHGFEVTGNETHRVVMDVWLIESIDELDDALLDEIAHRYATLVQIGHEIFTDSGI